MKKILLSISTTVRNPERLPDFLKVLKQLEGQSFSKDNQIKYQILLIQERLYKPSNIPEEYFSIFNDATKEIPYEVAEKTFHYQDYVGSSIRGRQSANPLNKLGFAIAKESLDKIIITPIGNMLLKENADVSNIFFNCILKLNFPNPLDTREFTEKKGFNINPFAALLHLLSKVDSLTQTEFSIFIPTLIHFKDIDKYADLIFKFRKLKTVEDKDIFECSFFKEFYKVAELDDEQLNNPFEYGDNLMRYFRLTKYFRVEKSTMGDWRILAEPTRKNEIAQLLTLYDGSAERFSSIDSYLSYISDENKPVLPWKRDLSKLKEITYSLKDIITSDFNQLTSTLKEKISGKYKSITKTDIETLDSDRLEKINSELRALRLEIIQLSSNYSLRKNLLELNKILNIFKDKKLFRAIDPEEFEFLISKCLQVIDDEIKIAPNLLFDDDGKPIGHAPGNIPDIECFYHSFNCISEVTLDSSRQQVYRESMPIMRHLRDFETANSNKPAYCIFVAPKVHNDTVEYFWVSINHGFQGKKQKIVPLSLVNFINILDIYTKIIKDGREFNHKHLMALFDLIVEEGATNSSSIAWLENINNIIEEWKGEIIK